MASPAFIAFFLLLISSTFILQIQARDSQFFSKVTPTTQTPTVVLLDKEKEQQSLVKETEQPEFVPQNENAYGLYGNETGLNAPEETDAPSTYTSSEKYFNNDKDGGALTQDQFGNGDGESFYSNNVEKFDKSSSNTEKDDLLNFDDAFDTSKHGNGETFYSNNNNGVGTEHYTTETQKESTDKNEDRFGSQQVGQTDEKETYYKDNRFDDNRFTDELNSRYKAYRGEPNVERKGMSDTRFVENGKNYYDLEKEQNKFENSRRNTYNNRGYESNDEVKMLSVIILPLITHEISHYIKNRKGRQGYMSVKLDINKAYDKLSWGFIERVLLCLGFAEGLVNLMMTCIKTVTYRIRLNGVESNIVRPHRGIRQGDPLSPYLFTLCAEWFTQLMIDRQRRKMISGIKICRNAPCINHMLFADDCLVFLRANVQESRALLEVLEAFEQVAGQRINLSKSEVCFGKNVEITTQEEISRILNMTTVDKHNKYLGLPISFGHNRRALFHYLEEKMIHRTNSWKSKLLSAAGKETLIKATLLPIPQYAMSCFMIPKAVCDKMTATMVRFWWTNGSKERGIHWMKKELLTQEKNRGGLGFKDLELLNKAFITKQLWRIMKEKDLLMSRIFTAKYLQHRQGREAITRTTDSHVWKQMSKMQQFLKDNTSINEDDRELRWNREADGEFSVKSAYKALHKEFIRKNQQERGEPSKWEELERFWHTLWKVRIPGKCKILGWRIYHNIIPTAENLRKKKCEVIPKCPWCGFEREDAWHALVECWRAQVFWKKTEIGLLITQRGRSMADWLFRQSQVLHYNDFSGVMIGLWILWNNRNNAIHNNEDWSIEKSITKYKFWRIQADFHSLIGGTIQAEDTNVSENTVTIRCDGSWSINSIDAGAACIGMERDVVIAMRALNVTTCTSALCTEVKAILMGLEMAGDMKIRSAQISSDAAEAIWSIQTGNPKCQNCTTTIDKCAALLSDHPSWTLNLIPRSRNTIADWAARKARTERWNWISENALPISMTEALNHHRLTDTIEGNYRQGRQESL